MVREIDAMLLLAPGADGRPTAVRARALARECGCAAGGAFLTITLILALGYVAVVDRSPRTAALAAGLVLGAAIAGKLLGIGVASARLVALRRTVRRETLAA